MLLKDIRPILQETYKKIEAMLCSPKYQGKEKVFIGLVSDSLNRKTINNNSEGGTK